MLALALQDARPAFSDWLAEVRSEAIARGVKAEIVDEALEGVEEPLPAILERDRAQAETVFSLEHYISRRLTPKLITSGREAFARHRDLLREIGSTYGVAPPHIPGNLGRQNENKRT